MCSLFSTAQSSNGAKEISGLVLDQISRTPVEYASVAIYHGIDSTLAAGTITDRAGRFRFQPIPYGAYYLYVDFVGYLRYSQSIGIVPEGASLPDTIFLQPSSTYLEGVTVRADEIIQVISADKTTIRTGQGVSSASGNITDMLREQPNITIDANNKILLRGNPNVLLLIDGSPADPDMVAAIPVSMVDKIEIIANPDVTFDADGTGGIINIITRKEQVRGHAGSIHLNIGFRDRYNGGFHIRLSGKKTTYHLNYQGRHEMVPVVSSLYRNLPKEQIEVDQEITSRQLTISHTGSIQFQHKLRKGHQLSGSFQGMFPRTETSQSISGTIMAPDIGESYNRQNEITFSRKMVAGKLIYKRQQAPKGRVVNGEVFFNRIWGSRPASYYMEDIMMQRSDGGGRPTIAYFQADMSQSYSGRGKLETGIRITARWNNFKYHFESLDTLTGQWTSDDFYSNDLEHRELVSAAWLMITDSLWHKWQIKAGIRAEWHQTLLSQLSTSDTIQNQHLFPLPFIMLQRDLNKKHMIAFTLNRRISRPTYPQLNPWVNVIDPITFESGNRHLVPEIADRAEISHRYRTGKFTFNQSLWYGGYRDQIVQVTHTRNDQLWVTFVNIDKAFRSGSDLHLLFDPGRKVSFSMGVSAFFTSTSAHEQDAMFNNEGFAWSASAQVSYQPKPRTTLQLSGQYESALPLPQFTRAPYGYADFSMRHRFADNRLSVHFIVSDIFNTQKWQVSTDHNAFQLENQSKPLTRIFWAGVSFTLQGFQPTQPSRPDSSGEDRTMIRTGQ
jgi:hypothetical protein